MPSFVAGVAFLLALAMPLVRRICSGLSMSPLDSVRARLQSIMPALVFSRSCLTVCGLISLIGKILEICGSPKCRWSLLAAATGLPRFSGLFADARQLRFLTPARFTARGHDRIDEFLQ